MAAISLLACRPKATYKNKEFYDSEAYIEFIDSQFTAIETKISILNASFKKNLVPPEKKHLRGPESINSGRKPSTDFSQEDIIKYNYARLLQTSDSAMLVISNLSAFGDDKRVKSTSKALCTYYNNIFHNEYRTLLEFYLSDNTPQEAQLDSINNMVSVIMETEDSLKSIYEEASEQLLLDQ